MRQFWISVRKKPPKAKIQVAPFQQEGGGTRAKLLGDDSKLRNMGCDIRKDSAYVVEDCRKEANRMQQKHDIDLFHWQSERLRWRWSAKLTNGEQEKERVARVGGRGIF